VSQKFSFGIVGGTLDAAAADALFALMTTQDMNLEFGF
jgi:hypothetical protein